MFTVLSALIQVVLVAINIYVFVLIASAVMSWLLAFNVLNHRNQLVGMLADFLYRVTEPALRPIRRFIPHLGGIDVSPVVLILILYFFQLILSSVLRDMYRGVALY
jgi:YggT family protein